jgi:hypothetical protein
MRPYGVSFLFAGWDERFGFQLFKRSVAVGLRAGQHLNILYHTGSPLSLLNPLPTRQPSVRELRVLAGLRDRPECQHRRVNLPAGQLLCMGAHIRCCCVQPEPPSLSGRCFVLLIVWQEYNQECTLAEARMLALQVQCVEAARV